MLTKALNSNEMLSYRRETALQGALVFGQKWKTGTGIQYFADIIGLFSTTVTQSSGGLGLQTQRLLNIPAVQVTSIHVREVWKNTKAGMVHSISGCTRVCR